MSDAPLIVLLPGLDGTGRMFGPFACALAAQYEVRVLRYPTDAVMGYEALTRFVQAVLPPDRAYVVVAESFSGPIGCALAAQRVAGMAGLVLCASFASSPLPSLRALAPLLGFAPIRAVPLKLLSWLLLGRWSTPALMAELRLALDEVEPGVLRKRAQAVLAAAAPAAPATGCLPVLYLQADSDRLVGVGAAQRLRATFPDAEVTRVAGPHFLLQAEPVRCAQRVSEFVQRVGRLGHQAAVASASQPSKLDQPRPMVPASRRPTRP